MERPDAREDAQRDLCRKHRAEYVAAPANLKLGIARNVRDGILPIRGMRIVPDAGTVGWFIWAGHTLSQDPDFFLPLHVEHVEQWVPGIRKYLGLPPGYRFIVAPRYEDVWFDAALLRDAPE